MPIWRPYFFDLFVAAMCFSLLALLFRWSGDLDARYRCAARYGLVAAGLLIGCASLFGVYRLAALLPNPLVVAVRGAGILCAAMAIYATPIIFAWRRLPPINPRRRNALKAAAVGAAAVPVAITAFGFIQRDDLRAVEVDMPVPGLPKDLHGIRIVQLTDIHLSPLVSESFLARSVDMANEARADIAIVTGDLVTSRKDPLDACLRQLGRLRSNVGTFGCMGNHERYAGAEAHAETAGKRRGIRFLRSEAQPLRFGDATLNLVGVDYQRMGTKYLTDTQHLILPGATNVLLTHNPDVFPVATAERFDVTLAGHTHGGQVNFEIIHPQLNIARFYTPYVHGLYELNASRLYVSRGIGTIGVPARIGAPPEIAILRLCAI
jgi:uncharacterized protein